MGYFTPLALTFSQHSPLLFQKEGVKVYEALGAIFWPSVEEKMVESGVSL